MMEELAYDIPDFTVYAIEVYRRAKNMSGAEVYKTLTATGALDYIIEYGDTLHCEGDAAIVTDLDEYLANHHRSVQEAGK